MKNRNILLAALLSISLITAGCGVNASALSVAQTSVIKDASEESESSQTNTSEESDAFSERDLQQEADLSEATYITLENGKDVSITSEGVYVIKGSATDSTIIVETDESAKVQLVLDGVTITNSDFPAIYVKCADKVFVTTTQSENTLSVTGSFITDGDTNTDAVIFSKDDLVLNGLGTLNISSTGNGISGKDDIKVTGGTYNITATKDGIEANDSLRINDGTFEISASEGLEATYVQINDGTINISASDDGINASSKSTKYDTTIEINGGNITIVMASGDTDALDANGNLYINGGTVDITAQFAFDFDGEAALNGGTVTVNGEEVTEITNSMNFVGQGGGPGFGQMPGSENGERPQFQDGEMPDSENGERPQFQDGEMPDFGNGEKPQFMNGDDNNGRNKGRF